QPSAYEVGSTSNSITSRNQNPAGVLLWVFFPASETMSPAMEQTMARTHFAVAAIVLSLSSVSASSQTLVGYGSATCASWIETHRSGNAADRVALDSWVFGYVDGLAKYVDGERQLKGRPPEDILKGLDRPSTVALTSQFCQANPAQTLDSA